MTFKNIATFLKREPKGKGNFYYDFLMGKTAKEQKKVIRRIAEQVNEDQRATIEKANRFSRQPS